MSEGKGTKRKAEEELSSDTEKKPRHCSDTLTRGLLRQKAESFAIEGPAEQTPIFTCTLSDGVVDVWKGLARLNILSVPVIDEGKRYIGFIDMLDVARFVVQHFGAKYLGQEKDFKELVEADEKFCKKSIRDLLASIPTVASAFSVVPSLQRNPFQPVFKGYSAWHVVEILAREPRVHRVAVLDRETHQLFNFVTQSQVIRVLHRMLGLIGDVKDKPLSEFKSHLFKPVVKVQDEQLAIQAFDMMVKEGVSAVAIVDDTNKLTGALSARDLKVIGTDARLFYRLHQSVKNFVLRLRSEYQKKHNRPQRVQYVLSNATLGEVITELAENHVHRLFIVDDARSKNPIGIVSLTDVLNEIVESV